MSFFFYYVFYKTKNSRQINPDNVVLLYFFCFILLPVRCCDKFVQMIKMFKTCCIHFFTKVMLRRNKVLLPEDIIK